jgi:hypothetical protein
MILFICDSSYRGRHRPGGWTLSGTAEMVNGRSIDGRFAAMGFRDPAIQGSGDPGIQGSGDSGIQGSRDPGIRGFRDPGVRDPGIQRFDD